MLSCRGGWGGWRSPGANGPARRPVCHTSAPMAAHCGHRGGVHNGAARAPSPNPPSLSLGSPLAAAPVAVGPSLGQPKAGSRMPGEWWGPACPARGIVEAARGSARYSVAALTFFLRSFFFRPSMLALSMLPSVQRGTRDRPWRDSRFEIRDRERGTQNMHICISRNIGGGGGWGAAAGGGIGGGMIQAGANGAEV